MNNARDPKSFSKYPILSYMALHLICQLISFNISILFCSFTFFPFFIIILLRGLFFNEPNFSTFTDTKFSAKKRPRNSRLKSCKIKTMKIFKQIKKYKQQNNKATGGVPLFFFFSLSIHELKFGC